jgi:hypothetical protein
MIRMILVAAAALASVSFSPGHAEGAEAPWCAVISLGTGDVHYDCQYIPTSTVLRNLSVGQVPGRSSAPRHNPLP